MHRPKRLISIVMMVLMIMSMSGSYLPYFDGMGASGSVYAAQNETASDRSTEDQASEPEKQSGTSTDSTDKDKEDAEPAADKTAPAERTIKAKVTSEEPYVDDEEGNRKSSEPLKAARRFWNSLTDRIAALRKDSSDDAITVEIKGKLPEDIKAEVKHLEFDEADEYDGYKESAVFAFELILTDGEGNAYVPEEPVEVTLGGKRIEEYAKTDDHFMLYAYEENSRRAEEYNTKYEEVLKKDNRNSFYAADVLVFDSKYVDKDDANKNKSYEVYDSKKEYKDGEDAVRYAEDKSGLSATKKNEIEFSYAYGESLNVEAEGEEANVDSARFVLSARKLKDAKADEAKDEDKGASEEPKVIKAGKITASDGRTYSISVKYGKTASIPEDAELKVEEINEKAKAFDAYMDASAELLESKKKDFVIARAFDITIVDPKTGDVYQPTDEVEVSIRLIDEKIKKDTEISVIHFEDPEGVDEKTSDRELARSISADQGQVLNNKVRWNGDVEFKTTGFSVFAVIGAPDGDQAYTDPQTYSVKYIFKYEDETPYTFPNENGVTVDYQFVPNGEAPYSPGTPSDPTLNRQGYAFKGWYEKNLLGGWADEPTIDPDGKGKVVSGISVFTTERTLYPRFEKVKHVYYYDESATGDKTVDPVYMIDVVDESEIVGNRYNTKKSDGEYRVNYLPRSASKAFLGWSSQPGKYQQSDVSDEYEFPPDTSADLIRLYPVIADVYWITFDKNDWDYIEEPDVSKAEWKQEGGKWVFVGHNNGGTHIRKGTGAQYVAPIHVLQGQTISEAGYTSLPTTTRPGYDFGGWLLPNGTQLNLNYQPPGNVTVTAKWTPSSVQNYSVVFWRQNATDDVNANPKTYYYDHTDVRQGTTGSTVHLRNSDKTGYGEGFNYNASASTESAVVKGDGSTVLNVYYDRNVYNLTFQIYDYAYTPTTSSSGTQYGLVDGEYIELTKNGNNWSYITGYHPTTRKEHGDYYISDGQGGYVPDYLYYNGGRWYSDRYYLPVIGYQYYNEYTGTVYDADSVNYTGTRYTRSTSWITKKVISGIYGHNIRRQFPIQGDDGVVYDGYSWKATDDTIYKYTLETIETIPAGNVTFHGSLSGTDKTIFYYVEALPGEESTRDFDGHHYKLYKTVHHSFNFITYNEEFYEIEGFSRGRRTAEPYFGQTYYARSNGTTYIDYYDTRVTSQDVTGSNENIAPAKYPSKTNYLYYNRNQYKLEFYNGHETDKSKIEGAEANVYYEASLQSYADWFTVSEDKSTITYNGHSLHYEGYVFDGWFKDDMCTERFNFDEEKMPSHPMKLYAGWKKLRYRVWVQPNGGELSESESTYFRVDWGEMINEYKDVETNGRKYTESTDGTYSYVYNSSTDPNMYPDARVAYYKATSELGLASINVNGQTIEYDETKLYDPEKKYTPVPDTTYSFIGWYKVKGEIDDDVPPDLGRDVDGVWNFNTPVHENVAIKAMWRRNGTFSIKYNKDMTLPDGSKVEGTLPYPISDDNVYIDLAQAVAPGAVAPPAGSNYIFAGWKTPDGEVHQPGQVFAVKSDYATEDPNEEGHYLYNLEPLFVKLGTSILQYDLNGGSYDEGKNMSDLGDAYGSADAFIRDYDRRRVTGLTKNTKVKLSDARDDANKLPTKKGFVFTGWNSKADPDSPGAIHYDIGGIYAVSGDVNRLYAEWTPIAFDFQFIKFKETYDPVTDVSNTDEHLNGATFKVSTTTDNKFREVTAASATGKFGNTENVIGVVNLVNVMPRSNREIVLSETRAPTGYLRNRNEYTVTGWKEPEEHYTARNVIGYEIKETGDGVKYVDASVDSMITITDPDGVVIDNDDNKIVDEIAFNTVELFKTDKARLTKPLRNASFKVTRKVGNEYVSYVRGNRDSDIYTTGNDGIAELNLMQGDYMVVETKAPAGYVRLSQPDGEYLQIHVTNNNTVTLTHDFNNVSISNRPDPNAEGLKIYTIKVPNEFDPGRKVILRKVDSGYNPVTTETFEVRPINGNAPMKIEGNLLTNLRAGSDGVFWIGTLPYGQYEVWETSQNNRIFDISVEAEGVSMKDANDKYTRDAKKRN